MRGDDLRGNDLTDLILANIHDMFAAYLMGGDNAPSILMQLIGEDNTSNEEPEDNDLQVFASTDDFDEARKRIIGGQLWPEQN